MILVGSVVGETDRGINIFVPFPERIDKLYDCHESVGVEFVDKRRISAKQRKKAYVLISYIAAWWGYTPLECMKEMLKLMFVGEAETLLQGAPHGDSSHRAKGFSEAVHPRAGAD